MFCKLNDEITVSLTAQMNTEVQAEAGCSAMQSRRAARRAERRGTVAEGPVEAESVSAAEPVMAVAGAVTETRKEVSGDSETRVDVRRGCEDDVEGSSVIW